VGVRLHRIWHNLGHLYQHWLINVVIGLAIEFVLIMAHNSIIVVAARNWALDAAMRGSAELAMTSKASPPKKDNQLGVVFIDVDEEAWRSNLWGGGEPFRAPRDGLMTLINYALDNSARYIVLDVITDGRVDPDDRTFSDQIVKRAAHLNPDQYLLFVRTLREPLPGMEQLAPELRTSPVDQALRDQPNKQFLMVAPYFQVSRDGVLRDWQLWRAGCRRDATDGLGHWEILPSVQLVISALELARTEKRPQDRDAFPWATAARTAEPCVVDLAALATDGAGVAAKDIDQRVRVWLHKQTELTGAKDLTPASDDAIELTNRIFFSYRYPAPSNVHVIPAIRILEHASPEDDERLANSLSKSMVVIGQSFEAARDQRMTPLGTMPGSMVLVNSVKSMLNMKLLQEPPTFVEYVFIFFSILVVGFMFAYFSSSGATVVLVLTFVPALLFVNYQLLKIHIWMDFAVPLLAIFAHRIIEVIEDWVHARRPAGASRSHD
jgi:CHASE2 domain-containing sensor protein